jgi:hypothetical protein
MSLGSYNRPIFGVMKSIPPVLIVAGLFAIVLGLPFCLYALLTRGQRRTTREIRKAAAARGWRYRRRRWQGNPTAFRIDGQTESGLPWVLTSGTSSGYDRGWSARMVLRFPTLEGETDIAVLPHTGNGQDRNLTGSAIPAAAEARLATWSGTLAGAVAFLRDSQEAPSGLSSFDAAYEVLLLPRIPRSPIDAALAARILAWPAEAVTPHSVLAWRDLYAFEFQVRLPAPPNWATVAYFPDLADDWVARLPAPVRSSVSPRMFDRLLDRFLR